MKIDRKLSIAIFACVLILSASFAVVLICIDGDKQANDSYSVGIIESGNFTLGCENPMIVKKGEDAVFRITLDDNCYFADLAGGKYEDGALIFENITSDRSIKIKARSYSDKLKLTSNVTGGGKVRSAEGRSEFSAGETVSVLFVPDENYLLSSVKINGKVYPLPEGAITVEAWDDIEVDAVFAGEERALSVLSSSSGIGNAVNLTPKTVYRYGDEVTLRAEYDRSSVNFLGWSKGGTLSGGASVLYANDEVTFTLTDDLVIYANFSSKVSFSVKYDANGGVCSSLPEEKRYGEGEAVEVVIDDGSFTYEGYRIVGFNEKSDLTGSEHSFGGAFPMGKGDVTLFAHWEKETPAELFDISENDGKITINGFSEKGKSEDIIRLVFPNEIGGKPVAQIAKRAFCGNSSLEIVVLPMNISNIGAAAFENCANIKRVYFPETIEEMPVNTFSGCKSFCEMRVLATLPRVFDIDYSSGMADRFMSLKSTNGKGKKRIIFVGGSNLTMGLDSALVDEAFPEYDVINFSNTAQFGALMLMEMVRDNISEGDIVVFSLEYRKYHYSGAQSSKYVNWDYIESNYDILHEVNIKTVSGLLNTYVDYLDAKRGFLEKGEKMYRSVVYSRSSLNSYGDDIAYREPRGPADTSLPLLSLMTTDGMEHINEFCREAASKGVRVLFTFPCTNFPEDKTDEEVRKNCGAFLEKFITFADTDCITVISDPYDYYYDGAYCYDSEYHLSTEMVPWRTNLLIRDLRAYFEKEGR